MLDTTVRWLEHLESDELPQGHHALRTPEGYCCLGIACELFRRETGQGHWVFVAAEDYADHRGKADFGMPSDADGMAIDHYRFVLEDGNMADVVLPEVVRAWVGLRSKSGSASRCGSLAMLSHLNDHGSSFAEIAAQVREHPGWYLGEAA